MPYGNTLKRPNQLNVHNLLTAGDSHLGRFPPGVTPPIFIAGLGVDAAIGGTVAQGAVNVMKEAGVDVILGVSGDPRIAALNYAAGCLKHDEAAIKPCGGC